MKTISRLFLSTLLFCLLFSAAAAENTCRALLVGCDYFRTQEDTFPSAVNNVNRMARVLQSGSLNLGYLNLYTDSLPDAASLEAAIQAAFGTADEDDTSYFYLSTHGLWQPGEDSSEVRFLLSDGLRENSITAWELRSIFDRIAGTKVLILDACHSGAMLGKGAEAILENVFAGSRCKILCSSGGAEESWLWTDEKGQISGGGYFSDALARGLGRDGDFAADSNRDGQITLRELQHYLLTNQGVSTPRCYPENDDFVLMRYDPGRWEQSQSMERIGSLDLEDSILAGAAPSLTFSFTVYQPVQVAYQLTDYENGRWAFEDSLLIWDNTELSEDSELPEGSLTPGHKTRSLSFRRDEDGGGGYSLLQLLTLEDGSPRVMASRLLCVTSLYPLAQLSVETASAFIPGLGEELPVFIAHDAPCELSALVVDQAGNTVARLLERQSTRPEHLSQEMTTLYWNGRQQDGSLCSAGHYSILVTAYREGDRQTAQSVPFELVEQETEK